MRDDDVAREILTTTRTWAVVGMSGDPHRPSNFVAAYLQRVGFDIVPVAPGLDEALGKRAYPTVAAAAEDHDIEVVDIFRRSEAAGPHIDEAIAVGAKAVWLQVGVVDEEGVERARAAGLLAVMNRCPKIDYPLLVGTGR